MNEQKLDQKTGKEETISPNPNCGICYGCGTMLVFNPTFSDFLEKECSCITQQRIYKT